MQKIIDFHTHVFPDKIAQKAVYSISDFYSFPRERAFKGNIEELVSLAKSAGVDYVVTCSTATTKKQVESINTWIATLKSDTVFPLGTLHPEYSDIEGEVERIIALGLYGIKLHPDFQEFNIDDEKAENIYKIVGDRLPILIHTGDTNLDYSAPKKLAKMADKYPNVRFIAPHLGGYSRWDEVNKYLIDKNVWFDTSSALEFMEPERATEIILKHGCDKVFFGTDYPLCSQADALLRFNKLALTESQKNDILFNNVNSFLNLNIK
ncbi:MAG: TatD family hydrolase [Clostridia bacterium]